MPESHNLVVQQKLLEKVSSKVAESRKLSGELPSARASRFKS